MEELIKQLNRLLLLGDGSIKAGKFEIFRVGGYFDSRLRVTFGRDTIIVVDQKHELNVISILSDENTIKLIELFIEQGNNQFDSFIKGVTKQVNKLNETWNKD